MIGRQLHGGLVYLVGQAATIVSNVAALMALTRLLRLDDFGRLSLASGGVVIAASICTLGLPQAAVRYLDEYRREGRLGTLYGSMVATGVLLGAVGASAALVARVLLPPSDSYRAFMIPAAVIIWLSTVNEVVLGLYRGWEKAAMYNIWVLIRRLGGVVMGIALLLWVRPSPETYLWGLAAGEGFALSVAAPLLGRFMESSRLRVDLPTALRSVAYGAPFVLVIASAMILNLADRYVIAIFAGERAVAIYAVAFGIATALASLLTRPVNLLVFPASMSTWNRAGQQKTEALLSVAADWYLFLSAPLILVSLIAGPWVVGITAGERFDEAAFLVPLLLCVFLLNGFVSVSAAGLYLGQRSVTFALVTASAAIGNILLNFLLVPALGVTGAAVAGMIANTVYIGGTLAAARNVRVRVSFAAVCAYAFLAAGAFLIAKYVAAGSAGSVIVSVCAAMSCYLAGAMLFSRRKRNQISDLFAPTRSS